MYWLLKYLKAIAFPTGKRVPIINASKFAKNLVPRVIFMSNDFIFISLTFHMEGHCTTNICYFSLALFCLKECHSVLLIMILWRMHQNFLILILCLRNEEQMTFSRDAISSIISSHLHCRHRSTFCCLFSSMLHICGFTI